MDALKNKDSGIRVEAVRALGEFEDRRALNPLIEVLNDDHPSVREAAIRGLKSYEDSRISDSVIRLLNDPSALVRSAAVWYIREKPDKRAVEALIPLLSDENTIASASAQALAKIGDAKAVDPLTKIVRSEYDRERMLGGDIYLRNSAINALGQIGDKKATPVVIDALQVKEQRISAVIALGALKDNRAVPALIRCLSDDDPYVQRLAASALREIGDPVGLEAVKDIPEVKPPPRVGSATPVRPRDVKPPPPSAIPKEPSPGSGYSRTMFPKHEKMEEKQPPPKEEKAPAISAPPLARVVSKYEPQPRPSVDIKPLLPKLKADDPKIRREAADSLGDAGNKEATDHLIPLLKDKDEFVRQAAARALGKLKDKRAVEPLLSSLKDPEINVRAFSIWALGEIQDPRAIEPLCSSLLDNEEKIRDHSFEALRKFREPASRRTMVNTLIKGAKIKSSASGTLWKLISLEGKEVILRTMEDPEGDKAKTLRNYIDLMEANIQNVSDTGTKALLDYPDRAMVISELSSYISTQTGTPTPSILLLGRLKDQRALPVLLDALNKRKDSYDRATVIKAIDELGDKEAVEPLLQILVDDKEYSGIRIAAARALGKFGDARAVEPLLQILKDERENKEVRRDAAFALGTFRDKRAVEPLINILKSRDEDIWLRVAAASSLGNIGDKRAMEPLQDALKDPSDYIRNAAQTALQKIRSPQ
jgi:HEAT repeat protein